MQGKINRIGVNKEDYDFGLIESVDGTVYYFDNRSLSRACQFEDIAIGDIVNYELRFDAKLQKQLIENVFIIDSNKNTELQDKLKEVFSKHYQTGDIANLADLGNILIMAQISPKKYGFAKLKDFFRQFPELMKITDKQVANNGTQSFATFLALIPKEENEEIVIVDETPTETPTIDEPISVIPPVIEITNDVPIIEIAPINETQQAETAIVKIPKTNGYNNYKEPALFKWAYIAAYSEELDKLKSMALNERWDYDGDTNHLSILDKYLKYTFQRLIKQDEGIIEVDGYATFNTGLVDKKYKPIFALFIPNRNYEKSENCTQKWQFYDFCVDGEKLAGKELVKNFKILPKRARYFEQISDMLFDPTSGDLSLSNEHILGDNINRLSPEFHKMYCPENFILKDTKRMSISERNTYFEELKNAIIDDVPTYRRLNARLNEAISLAIKKVEWNFKTAIPMYYPKEGTMSLLLPLAMTKDEVVDTALVVEKCKSGRYIGHTILTLDMAYSNARLISRPDSDWLSVENINETRDGKEPNGIENR